MAYASGTFNAAGAGDWVTIDDQPTGAVGSELLIMLFVTTSFVGTVTLEARSKRFPAQVVPVVIDASGSPLAMTTSMAFPVRVPARGLDFQLRCSAYTSGSISHQLGDRF